MSTSLPKAFWLGGQERARRVLQGVSIDYTTCGKWLRALASYNKVPKQLVVQKWSVTVWTKSRATGTCSWDVSCLNNWSLMALLIVLYFCLLFSSNFVILLCKAHEQIIITCWIFKTYDIFFSCFVTLHGFSGKGSDKVLGRQGGGWDHLKAENSMVVSCIAVLWQWVVLAASQARGVWGHTPPEEFLKFAF